MTSNKVLKYLPPGNECWCDSWRDDDKKLLDAFLGEVTCGECGVKKDLKVDPYYCIDTYCGAIFEDILDQVKKHNWTICYKCDKAVCDKCKIKTMKSGNLELCKKC